MPVGVGFGIRDAASAKAVAPVADAVVIGSALIQCLEGLPRDQVGEGADIHRRNPRRGRRNPESVKSGTGSGSAGIACKE